MSAQEHWTRSRQAVVITAEPEVVRRLASRLSMTDEQIVSVSENRAALPLWGSALNEYLYANHALKVHRSEGSSLELNGNRSETLA